MPRGRPLFTGTGPDVAPSSILTSRVHARTHTHTHTHTHAHTITAHKSNYSFVGYFFNGVWDLAPGEWCRKMSDRNYKPARGVCIFMGVHKPVLGTPSAGQWYGQAVKAGDLGGRGYQFKSQFSYQPSSFCAYSQAGGLSVEPLGYETSLSSLCNLRLVDSVSSPWDMRQVFLLSVISGWWTQCRALGIWDKSSFCL